MSLSKRVPRSTKRRTRHHVAREVAAEMLRVQAVELKASGLPYRAIGQRLGVTHTRARQLVIEALEAQRSASKETIEHLREMESVRLERLLARWQPIALADDLDVSTEVQGEDRHGNPTVKHIEMPAYQAGLKAAEMLIKLSARFSALYGLDAPSKHALTDPDGNSVLPPLAPAVVDALEAGYDEITAHARSIAFAR